jgi:hypothetical protein
LLQRPFSATVVEDFLSCRSALPGVPHKTNTCFPSVFAMQLGPLGFTVLTVAIVALAVEMSVEKEPNSEKHRIHSHP